MRLGEEMPTDSFDKKITEKFSKSTVRQAEKLIDNSPELKRLRSIKDGLSSSEITTGVNDQQYKDNYDKINWSKKLNKNPSYRVKVNGKYIDDEGKK